MIKHAPARLPAYARGRSHAVPTGPTGLDKLQEEAAGSTDGVNLLTYHRAKGLEWDAVFLPALEEGYLPVRHAKEEAPIAEERRLPTRPRRTGVGHPEDQAR